MFFPQLPYAPWRLNTFLFCFSFLPFGAFLPSLFTRNSKLISEKENEGCWHCRVALPQPEVPLYHSGSIKRFNMDACSHEFESLFIAPRVALL